MTSKPIKTIGKKLEKEDKQLHKTALTNFSSPDLILKIYEEISKTHLKDNSIKLLAFLTASTGYLKYPEDHKSLALKGYRSVGKDNVMKQAVAHFPEEDVLFLTKGTEASMEDSIDEYKIIVCSEINLKDEKGANAQIVETIKQITEGGTSVLKKKPKGRNWEAELIKQKQKSVLYSTTESSDDEELNTRFIVGSVNASKEKIRNVNKNTLDGYSGKIKREISESWIKYGIKNLLIYNDVLFNLDWLVEYEKFFDCTDSRSMRDVKRFMSIACAVAWLYQLQRKKDEYKRIIAEPFDFFIAMIISSDFFNHTYSGLGDQRLQQFIDAVNEYLDKENFKLNSDGTQNNLFPRHEIQKKLGVSTNTIKSLAKGCQSLSIIRYHHIDGNNIIYERCQKGIKRVLIGVNWRDLYDEIKVSKGINYPKYMGKVLRKLDFICKEKEIKYKVYKKQTSLPHIFFNFDTLFLTPCSSTLHLGQSTKGGRGE